MKEPVPEHKDASGGPIEVGDKAWAVSPYGGLWKGNIVDIALTTIRMRFPGRERHEWIRPSNILICKTEET